MWNNHNGKKSGFLLLLLTSLILSSCAPGKKTVDPYPDSSYTTSVAREHSSKPAPGNVSEKTIQESRLVIEPADSQQVQSPKEISSEAMLPLLTLVDDRIVAYEMKIEQWEKFVAETLPTHLDEEQQDKLSVCDSQLTQILSRYNDLHQQLISESGGDAADISIYGAFLTTERQDMAFLESDCQQVVMAAQRNDSFYGGTWESLLAEKERELNESMVAGDYLQVVALYGQLPLEEGERASYETSYSYGQALLRTGRENDASKVFQELLTTLQKQNQIEREFKLMQLIADIQFSMEHFDSAFERYVDIINRYAGLGENIDWARKQQSVINTRNSQTIEVRSFAELMRRYLTYNPDRDAFKVSLLASRFLIDFPGSSVTPTVNYILLESNDRAEAWFAQLLQRINTLKGDNKHREALQIINQLPKHEMPMEKKELLGSLTDELISISFEAEESRRLALEEAMQDIWNKGQNYLRAKEYDQAIEVFSTLLDTTYAERANDKIVEASQLAAQEDRRNAAELFVQASRTTNQDKRVDLLFQSRELLKGILVKYPQSGLAEKAERNLERIEEEIKFIDPALLAEPEVSAESQDFFQQAVETKVNSFPNVELNDQIETGLPQQ